MRQSFITKGIRYYKVLEKFIQDASGIRKCGRLLLESASGNTSCGRPLLQSASDLIQSVTDLYYKARRNTYY